MLQLLPHQKLKMSARYWTTITSLMTPWKHSRKTCKSFMYAVLNIIWGQKPILIILLQEQEIAKQQQLQHEEKKVGPLTSSFLKRR